MWLAAFLLLFVVAALLNGQDKSSPKNVTGQDLRNESPQRSDSLPKSTPKDDLLQQLLNEIEGELRGTKDAYQASGYAHLARLYFRRDPDRAERLWTDAFYSTLSMERKSTLLTIGSGTAEMQANTYRRATEETPAKVQAAIFRDLADAGQLKLAAELLIHLPRYASPQLTKGATFLPIMLRNEADLVRALLRIPELSCEKSPDESIWQFGEILSRFENFPYSQAQSYLKTASTRPEVARTAGELLLAHLASRKLDPENLAVSGSALREFAGLLPALEPMHASRGARLMKQKLDALVDKSERWNSMRTLIEPQVCRYLDSDKHDSCKNANSNPNEGRLPPDLPTGVKETLELERAKRAAVEAAKENPDNAVKIAESIRNEISRAEVFVELAAALRQDNPARARELIGQAIDLLEQGKSVSKSKKMQAINRVALVAMHLDGQLFLRTVKMGVVVLGEDSLEPGDNQDIERIAFVESAVRLLGLWTKAEPENALRRIRSLLDSGIKLRALIEAARFLADQPKGEVKLPAGNLTNQEQQEERCKS